MSSRTGNRAYRRNREYVLSKNNICHGCGFQIDMDLKFPDPMSASVDHIIPYSKGGSDNVDNLVPMHVLCNQKKHSKKYTDQRKTGGVEW